MKTLFGVGGMNSHKVLISAIESKWLEVASQTIADTIAEHPSEQFYVAGFSNFYCDGSQISPPCFSMNVESELVDDPDAEFSRWAPPEWLFDVFEEPSDVMRSAYKPLCGEHDEATWKQIFNDHLHAIARVCRHITAAARNRSGPFCGLEVHQDFVVGIFHIIHGGEMYDGLVRLSIDQVLIDELGILEYATDEPINEINDRIGALSPAEKIAFWIQELKNSANGIETELAMLSPCNHGYATHKAMAEVTKLGEIATEPLLQLCEHFVDAPEFENGSRTRTSEVVGAVVKSMQGARLGSGRPEVERALKELLARAVKVSEKQSKWGLYPFVLALYLHQIFGYPFPFRRDNDELEQISDFIEQA